ncbi:hypothetical protein [Pleionea mediterranea]|uniref:Uncharacterized protein n=1 Tax=Pleionea mediterranea TaxID=523701 RepID=A0A316FXV1_9GAMM|nr:hypothetical protein [Pleionea mediterranea]PWK53419.1 hypothetical protein C8D97_103246 [Pleionea mediterranea]
MIKKTTASILLAASLFTHSIYSHNESAEKCIDIIDNLERLTCYDQYFKAENRQHEPNNNLSQTQSVQNSENIQTYIKKDENKVSKDLFGLEKEVVNQTPDEITSKAIGEFKSWNKKMQVPLKNGQVWQVKNSRSLYYPVTNPKITISKGVLGSFYMSIEGINRRLKVMRVK